MTTFGVHLIGVFKSSLVPPDFNSNSNNNGNNDDNNDNNNNNNNNNNDLKIYS